MHVYKLEHVNVQKGVEKWRHFVYNIRSELVNKLTIEEVLMYKILERKQLADKIYYMVVDAPRVAKSCLPGQFVIVKMDEIGERIPLTICDYDREAGTVTIVFQIVGASTERMSVFRSRRCISGFCWTAGMPI